MLKGRAKTDYMREYMRKRRLKGRLLDPSVRPYDKRIYKYGATPINYALAIDADGNVIPGD